MREEKGKFSSIEDLKGIKGIGDKTFEKMRNYLTVEGGISHGSVKASSEGEGRTSRKSGKSGEGGRSSKKAAPAGKVNLNTASADELQTLKGIGEKKALEIIEYREAHGGFKKIEEIMEIKGIGEKSFEKLKDYLTVK
ncbi:ComEA family DNA-binding protein [bacterium]|nr:ComEA family DNA-binding protein [bacterium]